jgi:signal peptidase I
MSSTAQTSRRRDGRRGGLLSGLAVALGCVLFLGGFGWGVVLYQPYTVPTDSMDPTIKAGDRVLAQRIDGSEVHRGDVVVFKDPSWGDLPEVKRAVAVGGDKVSCCTKKGLLQVNGTPVEEPYLLGDGPASITHFSTTVPKGSLFLMGDHRQVSQDSRVRIQDSSHGSVPRADVKARVDATVWPFSGAAMVTRPAGFADLPGGTSQPGPLLAIFGAIVAGALLIFGGAAYGPIERRRTGAPRGRRG